MIDVIILGIASAGITKFLLFCIGDPDLSTMEAREGRIFSIIGEHVLDRYSFNETKYLINIWSVFICKYCLGFWVALFISICFLHFPLIILVVGISHLTISMLK